MGLHKASCGKPGTEFASLLTSGLLICIPWCCISASLDAASDFRFERRIDVFVQKSTDTHSRPTLDVFLNVHFLGAASPSTLHVETCGIPSCRVIGPTLEDIWFIMWCGDGSAASSRPDCSRQNSTSEIALLLPVTVFPGPHVDCGCRPPSVPVTTKLWHEDEWGGGHSEVDQANAHPLTVSHDQRVVAGPALPLK